MWTDQGPVSSCCPTSTDALRCFSATSIGLQKKPTIFHCVLSPATFVWTPSLALKYDPWPCKEQINELKGMWSSRGVPPFILILKMQNCLNSQAERLRSQAEKASAIFSSSLKNIPEEGSRHIWEAIFRLLAFQKDSGKLGRNQKCDRKWFVSKIRSGVQGWLIQGQQE